jgi:hypothetical protein
MPDSYPFMVYSGIFEPKHYKQIGPTIWFFLWCIKSITEESVDDEGITWGHILYKKPMNLQKLAEPFDVNGKTISRWIEALEQHQYIKVVRAPYGLILSVRNSKKYRVRTDKDVRSDEGEQTKVSDLSPTDKTYMSDLSDKNVRSNIELIKTLIDRLIDGLDDHRLTNERCGVLTTVVASLSTSQIHLDHQTVSTRSTAIEKYYMDRKGRFSPAATDFTPIQQLAKMPIPLEFIHFGTDLAFARHEKTRRWPTDTINQFSYCQKVIIGTWNRLLSDIAETESLVVVNNTMPTASPSRRTQRQQDADELNKFIEEERSRGSG